MSSVKQELLQSVETMFSLESKWQNNLQDSGVLNLMRALLAICVESFLTYNYMTFGSKMKYYLEKKCWLRCRLCVQKTVPVTYLHMSVESWVPKVYSVEAILLMSSAAPEKELLLHSSNTAHSTRLHSEKLTANAHSCSTQSSFHSAKKTNPLWLFSRSWKIIPNSLRFVVHIMNSVSTERWLSHEQHVISNICFYFSGKCFLLTTFNQSAVNVLKK